MTAFGETDSPEGWRPGKVGGGVVMDVPSGETIVRGLCMPHSPRLQEGKLWVLDSGNGRLVVVDQKTGSLESVAEFPGYTRGLAFLGRYAFVGYSKIRETGVFGSVPVAEGRERRAGVGVVDIVTGKRVGFIEFDGIIDSHGRITSVSRNGTPVTYTYDNSDQLTADGTTTVTYDANGNRNNGSYSTGTGNRLTSDGTWTYTYDDEGNLTKKSKGAAAETWTYGYDQTNHLISVKHSATDGGAIDKQVDFKYDAWGNRLEKSYDADGAGSGSAVVAKFAVDGWNPAKPSPIGTENFDVWADLDSGGSLTTRYLRGDAVDQVFARIASGSGYYFLNDHLGSIREVAQASSGNIVDTVTYDAFGNITAETNSSYRGRYAWTGRELDTEINLQYNRARYYDAAIGRWISQDPLGFDAGDGNLYRYVNNSPIGANDPSGKFMHLIPIAIGQMLRSFWPKKMSYVIPYSFEYKTPESGVGPSLQRFFKFITRGAGAFSVYGKFKGAVQYNLTTCELSAGGAGSIAFRLKVPIPSIPVVAVNFELSYTVGAKYSAKHTNGVLSTDLSGFHTFAAKISAETRSPLGTSFPLDFFVEAGGVFTTKQFFKWEDSILPKFGAAQVGGYFFFKTGVEWQGWFGGKVKKYYEYRYGVSDFADD